MCFQPSPCTTTTPSPWPIGLGVKIIHQQGVAALYSGVSATILRQGVYSTTTIGLYDIMKKKWTHPETDNFPLTRKIAAGLIAGGVGAAVGNPADVAMVRMQADGRLPLAERRNYKSVLDAITRMIKKEGITSLWRGSSITMTRAMLVTVSQLSSYDQFKEIILKNSIMKDGFGTYVTASFAAGFVAAVMSNPVDVIKTRVMNMKVVAGVAPPYKGPLDCLLKTVRTEGPMALYKGFIPTISRQGPFTVVLLVTLEQDLVKCVVVDGGELKSRRHLNVRGRSATLPSITDKDWEDIKFGVDNQVDFYAVSFVKDAKVVHELKDYLKRHNADIYVIVKIESADAIPNLHSILSAADGAMVARGDLGAELPIEEVPLLQEDIINRCRSMQKPVIVATNMLESMITHPMPTRAEVSDIAIAVKEGSDAIMLSGETANGKYPLKSVIVMHTVALRTESTIPVNITAPSQLSNKHKSNMGDMFALHSSTMSNTLGTPIIVFTRTGAMAVQLSHYRPSSTIFTFTNEERVKQRLALYQGVRPIYMKFSDDAEETFSQALTLLLDNNLVKAGQFVTLVQSGAKSIWRQESTHHIQVRQDDEGGGDVLLQLKDGDSLIVAVKPKPPPKHFRDGLGDDDDEDDLKFQLPRTTSRWKRRLFLMLKLET